MTYTAIVRSRDARHVNLALAVCALRCPTMLPCDRRRATPSASASFLYVCKVCVYRTIAPLESLCPSGFLACFDLIRRASRHLVTVQTDGLSVPVRDVVYGHRWRPRSARSRRLTCLLKPPVSKLNKSVSITGKL